jgi:hypothetical protein
MSMKARRATGCLAGVGLLLALMSGGVGAQQQQDTDSANYMLPHCKRSLTEPQKGAPFMNGVCAGSILSLGFVGPGLSSTLRFCPPQQASRGQMVRVVVA